MNKIFEKYISRLGSPKILIVIGLIGIGLIFISSFSTEKSGQQAKTNLQFSTEDYCEELESAIKKTVIEITGSKNCSVIVTLESGIRYSYADVIEENSTDKTENEEQTKQNEHKSGYVTVKTAEGGEQALLVTAEMPSVRGVAIVCDGGDNEILNQKIENAVTAALNITSKRVYICGRKN